ncbi:nucleotidyltransferase family protein [Enterobacter sp.]|uniref:nucleotidyltransferase family protein n=1 Tax=Enterobacter sp. TaxID=42895 RepID=UPI00296E74A5|nr:nucleotidyltransferase family protein [Enterobacter sp.]
MLTPSPTAIILAAGKGARFLASGASTHKLDTLLHGKTVLQHVIEAAQASGLPWHLVRPDGGTPGMGDSVAMGVRATPDAGGWLILPGDLPLITPDTLKRVAAALTEGQIVVPHYQQQFGHPVGFGRAYFSSLCSLSGDTGAREIVREARLRGKVHDLPLYDRGIVEDIDVLTDLQRVINLE